VFLRPALILIHASIEVRAEYEQINDFDGGNAREDLKRSRVKGIITD
jgi:hypothetical protein